MNNLGVCLGEESIPGYLIVFVHFLPFHQSWCGFHLLKQLLLESEDFVFGSAPTQTCSCFPLWYAVCLCSAASLLSSDRTVVDSHWKELAPSPNVCSGRCCCCYNFFVSCFRTARMFLFAYILVIMSPRELNVAFLYLFW